MFFDQIMKRRSIRKFKKEAVQPKDLEMILKCGLAAPSSRSLRPWEFIVVDDPALLQQLADTREHSSDFLSGAPVGIVIVADPNVCDVWIEDTSIAATYIQLAAHDMGYGSCWIQIRDRASSDGRTAEEYVREKLMLPESFKVLCIIAIGHPGEKKAPYQEEKLMLEKVHYNQF